MKSKAMSFALKSCYARSTAFRPNHMWCDHGGNQNWVFQE